MTPPATARLKGYFVKKLPLCVLVRRGPAKYSQMILWHTDIDEFVPGQWIKGKVDHLTMTSDGRYAAIGIMRNEQHLIVCRPPFFTALEVWINGLCVSALSFLPDDTLYACVRGEHKVLATNPCPLRRVGCEYNGDWPRDHDAILDASRRAATGFDQQGRPILLHKGRVYSNDPLNPRLLFDANEFSFEEVIAPDWARNW